MNVLKRDKQVLAVSMLTDGSSVRSVERVTGVHRDTLNRRLSRLTLCFSKKWENMLAALRLHFEFSFVRKHRTLQTPPDVAAGISHRVWTMEDLLR